MENNLTEYKIGRCRCSAMRDKFGLDEPAKSTTYELEYRGVHCVEVDWERMLFTLVVDGKKVVYKQPHYIESSADTDHIRMVIDLYLEDLVQKVLSNKKSKECGGDHRSKRK